MISIAKTEKTPRILFNPDTRVFEIEGNSRPENVRDFYYPLIETIEQYFAKASVEQFKTIPFNFHFRMGYFNSSSAKFFADILMAAAEHHERGINIIINWYYEDSDEDMRSAGEDFEEMSGIPFKFITLPKE